VPLLRLFRNRLAHQRNRSNAIQPRHRCMSVMPPFSSVRCYCVMDSCGAVGVRRRRNGATKQQRSLAPRFSPRGPRVATIHGMFAVLIIRRQAIRLDGRVRPRKKAGWPSAGFIGRSFTGCSRRLRPPARDRPRALPRLHIVDAREQLAQLDGSREFAALLVGSADRGSLRFGDDEHCRRMDMRIGAGKRLHAAQPFLS
jgi:hypothetical protein